MKLRTFLTLTLVVSAVFTSRAYDFESDGIYYNKLDGNNIELVGITSIPADGSFTVPQTVNYDGINYTVTAIGGNGFNRATDLRSINLPNTITSIGHWTFTACGITEISIPDGVIEIGDHAFSGCPHLTTVTLGKALKTIGKGTFMDCTNLHSFLGENTTPDHRCVVIENTLCAFASAGLTEYTLPSSITAIGCTAMALSHDLKSVVIPNSVTSIGERAFYKCENLSDVKLSGALTSIETNAFESCVRLSSVDIPNTVTSLGNGVFADCEGLTRFTGKFASSDNRCLIASGKVMAFAPNGLTSYTLPESVERIGAQAFYHCKDLKSVIFTSPVIYISSRAFARCGFEEMELPASVSYIEDGAFEECRDLKTINIPASVIGDRAFEYCTSLQSVNLSEYAMWIGKFAFHSCISVTDVTIGEYIRHIESWAFSDCRSLTSFTCAALYPEGIKVADNAFWCEKGLECTLYVPIGCGELYRSAPVWCDFKDIVEKDLGGVEPTPIDANNNLAVRVDDGGNVVVGGTAGGESISVYSLAGRLLYSGIAADGVTSLPISLTPGCYIVKVADTTVKVLF